MKYGSIAFDFRAQTGSGMRINHIGVVHTSSDVESRLWAVNYGQTISKFATCVLRAHVALVATSVFRNGPRGIFSRPFGSKS